MKTCFVITGYGVKKDYINNRDIDLDKTFKHIIKPVFEDLGYECKRSCDYPPGMIDTIMYSGIYNADFVIADISTLNPNALYELGVRHALKPFTTLVICEDGIFINNKLPFDLNHLTALSYRHDGKSLDIDEVERFRKVLKDAVTGMVIANKIDSPVFTHITGLKVAVKETAAEMKPQKNVISSPQNIDEANKVTEPTLAEMIDTAVAAVKNKKFEEAIMLFEKLLQLKPGNIFFVQQLCLGTYKSKKPDAETANKNAFKILEQLNPSNSADTETLGMAGAIHKNLYSITGDKVCLEKSLRFYERGYYIANDYYNGINTVFLYWKMASVAINKEEARFYKMQAEQIAKNVINICTQLMAQPDYAKRNDKEWIINTLAEAYFGLDDITQFEAIIKDRQKTQSNFSEETFMQQFEELKIVKKKVENILK
jgi:tetratricopeptide (TPR) repeat protein